MNIASIATRKLNLLADEIGLKKGRGGAPPHQIEPLETFVGHTDEPARVTDTLPASREWFSG